MYLLDRGSRKTMLPVNEYGVYTYIAEKCERAS